MPPYFKRTDYQLLTFLIVTPQMYNSSRDKLVDLTRNKCKMFVTKWELLLILQMNARDVKAVSQFMTGEDDPM